MAIGNIIGGLGKVLGNIVTGAADAANKAQTGQNTSYINQNGQKTPGVYLDSNGQADIGTQITQGINSGLSYSQIQNLLNQRNDKISSTPGLGKYANDSVSQAAQNYISQGKFNEQLQGIQNYYSQIAAQQEAAKRAQVESAVTGLEGQKGGINQSYSDLFRQLYVDRMNSEKNLPQQMAAMGYTGGLTESAALDLQNTYANSLRQGEQQRLSTLSDIDRAVIDARLQGDISIAEQAAQLAQQGLTSYTDLLARQQQQANVDREYNWNREQAAQSQSNTDRSYAMQQAMLDLDREDVSYERKLQAAQYLYENTGDASGFSMLGYTPQQIAAMGNSYAAMLAGKSTSGSGGSVSGGKPRLSQSATMEAIEKNLITPEVKSAFEYYYGEPFDSYYTSDSGGKENSYATAKSGVDNMLYNLGRQGLSNEAIGQRVAAYIDNTTMTDADRSKLVEYVAQLMKL